MRAIWDGLMSALVALCVLALCALPIWGSYQALNAGLVPVWYYAPLAIFGFVAVLIAFDFFRKAISGIAPLRDRRR